MYPNPTVVLSKALTIGTSRVPVATASTVPIHGSPIRSLHKRRLSAEQGVGGGAGRMRNGGGGGSERELSLSLS